jgi:hypothetical protein
MAGQRRVDENRAFSPQKSHSGRYSRLLYQPLTRQIRYLADQWKINGIFSPINEFEPPYQPNNNRIRAGRKNRVLEDRSDRFRNRRARGYAGSERWTPEGEIGLNAGWRPSWPPMSPAIRA